MKGFVIQDETTTLQAVVNGASIGRLGDGEVKLIQGHSAKSQEYDKRLATLMKEFVWSPGKVLCGVPTFDRNGPKWTSFWHAYERRFRPLMNPSVRYSSAFVSRPDSAPHIDCKTYWDLMRQLWKGKDIVLVRGSGKSLTKDRLDAEAACVHEILCPVRHAFSEFDSLCDEIRAIHGKRTVLLACGATATALAYVLGNEGIHMVDLGHAGLWVGRREGQVAAEHGLNQ